ncbi:MAG: LLM class flavin-dependent oxidoreductase [Zoogloeaceae bacterium]|jgi:FMN-dependent oxidoreductase (nitrilotriacetate monooxygenase family)|nr:LLM class flavin-dependent oxidoreductase [Zoogloeaceae bacterium]
MPKQLVLNLFEMNCVSHIVHGLWPYPDNNRHRINDIEYWKELARLLEYGTFDAVFLADVIGAYDTFRGGFETSVKEAMQIPRNDPFIAIAAMAAVTHNLGFGGTFSTTYEPPFSFAQQISTLDHLTNGRIGWNIVTSYLPNAARNFGLDEEIPHDRRFELADEYIDVLYKLWEGSWEDDAVLLDRERRIYADPAKVHYINHASEHWKVKGPHLAQPSRQRTPVLFEATGSRAGAEFAGRHAEVVFTGGAPSELRKYIHLLNERAIAHGRGPGAIKVLVPATIIVGRTELEARTKYESYRVYQSPEGGLAHRRSEIDLTLFPKNAKLADVLPATAKSRWQELARSQPDLTVGQLLGRLGGFHEGHFTVVGTPKTIVDAIERWLDEDGIDGINLVQYLSYQTARDFIELVIPELRRRGRFREAYNNGETLRERLFGKGHARLPPEHYGAIYRNNPAALSGPPSPLVIPPPSAGDEARR